MANSSNNRNTKRTRAKDSTKKIKKKVSVLVQDRYSRHARRPSAEAAGERPLRLADRA